MSDVRQTYGFDPAARASRSWLWGIDENGVLWLVGPSGKRFPEANYLGHAPPMVGGEGYAEHRWRPL